MGPALARVGRLPPIREKRWNAVTELDPDTAIALARDNSCQRLVSMTRAELPLSPESMAANFRPRRGRAGPFPGARRSRKSGAVEGAQLRLAAT